MKEAYFEVTREAYDRITETFDLVHPITISVWNMRSEIIGIKEIYPEMTESKFNNRYNYASVVHGVNYKRTFIDNSWEDFQEKLAWLLLSNLFSIYEGWLAGLHNSVFPTLDEKKMQFPSSSLSGISYELNRLTTTKSAITTACFYNRYKGKKHYSSVPLDNLIYCYRYFKELRNCYIHNGIKASQKLCDAYNDFLPYHSASDLGIKEKLEIISPVLGKTCRISLRGVIGFSEIILRLLVTCDAELLQSMEGEQYLIEQLRAVSTNLKVLSGNPTKALHQAGRYCVKAGFMMPDDLETMKRYLLANKIVSL